MTPMGPPRASTRVRAYPGSAGRWEADWCRECIGWGAGAGTRIDAVIPRYSRPDMARVWSEEAKLERWLRVELASTEACAELGVVPASDATAIAENARVPSPERVAELERTTDHDVAAFVDAVAEGLGPEGRWLHYGLTSSDVVDTALALAVQDAGLIVLAALDAAFRAAVSRAEEHAHTEIGRAHV